MSTADHILGQIDNALHDTTVGPDAMRSTPRPAARPQITPFRQARQLLIDRLIDNHGLAPATARPAVLATEQGHASRHADLVRAEARAVMREAAEPIRAALQPALEAAVHAMRAFAEACKRMTDDAGWTDTSSCPAPTAEPRSPHDRPAWQTPYGPAPRRRRA
ncbi:hypothetical protein C9F11_38120 [Streptomyces sp. YIM 121038]|uniref:hypothetical protein n=1 Tax=Streptomyces sp. YIM 121038 TaxID=2136401 RepID=UPI001110E54F|nr:hypothetical protein [Streptomyces sp. YIM 121038]QCX81207.1 hypothetical protein C9F11_38120 [Streptomyces sp. YIM 121038]